MTENQCNVPMTKKSESHLISEGFGIEREIWGYQHSFSKTCICWLGYLLSGFTLRLIFHWYPHWQLYSTHRRCHLNESQQILVKDEHGQYSVHEVCLVTRDGTSSTSAADESVVISVTANLFNTIDVHAERVMHEEIPIVRASSDRSIIRFFFYKKLKYIWCHAEKKFKLLKGWEDGPCSQFHRARPLDPITAARRHVTYGENMIYIPITPLLVLLLKEGLNPFYIFQVLSCLLWYLDNYWMYATCIVVISAFSLAWQLYEMRKNERSLRDTVHSTGTAFVQRGGDVYQEMDAAQLVPGDIIEIPRNGCTMHCDAVLVSGNAIVNESMLTGESVPVTKTPIPRCQDDLGDEDEHFDVKKHSRHILFCGTRVIQTRHYEGERVTAVVARTGFRTAKGDMVRSILFPKPVEFKFNQDAVRYVMVLGLFALLGFAYTIYIMLYRGYGVGKILLRSLDLITIVVPPALPVAMTVGIVFAQRRLKRKDIFCISPNSINIGGVINVVCFDKTGTLTEDGLDLWGVVPMDPNGLFNEPEPRPNEMPAGPLLETMAACHSLTRIDGELSGDPLDIKMFQATDWEFLEEISEDHKKYQMAILAIVRPVDADVIRRDIDYENIEETAPYEVGILRQFTFSSSLQRMSVIAKVLTSPHFNLYVKGSPEIIETLSRKDTLPRDFHTTLLKYTRQGFRVIALAWKPLRMSYVKLQRARREDFEKDLHFLGLLVMENRLKPETTPVIEELRRANIRPVMVTGDNMLTALSVARDCQMIDEADHVILVTSRPPSDDNSNASVEFHYAEDLQRPVTEVSTARSRGYSQQNGQIEGIRSSIAIRMIDRPDFHLALSGKTWAVIKEYAPHLIDKLVVKGTVFARFSPDQKAQLVDSLQAIGYYVGMCGDGANDCGALKAAHTGISLSEAEASVASPFTSRQQNISCVPELVREGRCALATSFGTFKFMAAYSLTQFVSVLLLYWIGANLTDFQFLYIDLGMITTISISFGYTRAYSKLSVDPPSMRLISVVTVSSLVSQMVIHIAFQASAFVYIREQPWFLPFRMNLQQDDYICMENTAVFIISSFQYITLAVVFSKGAPYRRSIFSNYFFITNVVVLLALTFYICFNPFKGIQDFMGLVNYPSLPPRGILLGAALANFLLAYLIESAIEGIAFRRRVRRIKRILFPKRFRQKEYERIREEIHRSAPTWPPLRKAASVQDLPAELFNEGATRPPSRHTVTRQMSADATLLHEIENVSLTQLDTSQRSANQPPRAHDATANRSGTNDVDLIVLDV